MFIGLAWNKAKWVIWCFFLFLSPHCLANTDQPGSASQISYRVDFCQTKSPIHTIDEAISCDYESPYHPLSLGFGEAPRWVRVQISTGAKNNQLFAIQVRPYFLRDINFFHYSDGQWIVEKAGSFVQNEQSHSDIGGHFFITKENLERQNTYYLQIQASSIARISVSAIAWPNSSFRPSGHLIGIGAQIGILITILVFSLVSLALNPTRVMARFNAYIANLIICILAGSGILALFVFPQMPVLNELIFFIGLCLKLAFWVWLAQTFLQGHKAPQWYQSACKGIYGLVGLSIILGIIGKIDLSVALILLGYTATAIFQIYAVNKTPGIERQLRNALTLGFSATIALIYLAASSAFFPLEANSDIPLYLARLTDFVNPLVMLTIIVFQNRLVRKELLLVKNALTETKLRSEFESKLLQDRKTLVDMLAHELKNPLASIGLAISTLSQSKETQSSNDQRRIENINAAILSMDNIIERCSLINSIDQNTITLNPIELHLSGFISTLVDSLNCRDQVVIEASENIFLRTDLQFLHIILKNLIENALKYSPPEMAVRISVQEFMSVQAPSIQIAVSNTVQDGWMPDADLIFERFYRHPMARKIRGSGLGLSICQELSKALGGKIICELSKTDATFIVELPK